MIDIVHRLRTTPLYERGGGTSDLGVIAANEIERLRRQQVEQWEGVAECLYRCRAPGGWIYSTKGSGAPLCFVPDQEASDGLDKR